MADHNKYHNGQIPYNGYRANTYYSTQQATGDDNIKEDEINLKQLLYVFWNRKWIILGSMIMCGLLAVIIAFASTPIYQSDGSMLIEDSQSSGALGSSGGLTQLLSSSYGLGIGSTLANELQVLRSRKLSAVLADTLMGERLMPDGSQFPVLFRAYPNDSVMTSQDTVAARIRNNIRFAQVDREANVVQLKYESPAPYEAAHIINLNMAIYNNLSANQNRSSANSAVTFLEKERKRIKNNLQDSEEKLRVFMNRSKLINVDPQTETLINQIADLQSLRQEARTKLVAVNSALNQYQDKLNSIIPGLAEKYSEAIGPNISKLQYAKSELELQKQQLLTQNPNLNESSSQIISLNRQINSYKQKIKELTQSLIDQSDQYLGFLGGEGGVAQSVSDINQKIIESQVQQKQYQAQIEVVDAQLKKRQQFFDDLPDNIIDLAKIKRDVKINEQLYETVSEQYAQTALWEQTQFGLGRIIDNGYIPKEPVSPKKRLYVLIGLIVGGILGVGYVFIKEAYNITIDSVEKMKKLDEPLLSVIPIMSMYLKEQHGGAEKIEIQGKNISTGLVTVLDSISPVSESFRQLQNNLIYSNPDADLKTIMITSSGKGEGKTTTIANLGVTLAEAGYNTIIVDVDFRRPNVHNMFGANKTPGFIDVLFDDISLGEGIQATIIPGLSILPTGRKPPNVAAISQSHAFVELLKDLESQYDFVLIDTAPIGIITDASAIVKYVDSVAVVVKFGETTDIQLNQTLERLHRLQANVAGTILTAFDHNKSNDYNLSSNYYKQIYQDYSDYKEEV